MEAAVTEIERKVWASTHGVVACLPHMGHGDIYASSPQVFARWHDRSQPVYVVGFDLPAWLPEGVNVEHV